MFRGLCVFAARGARLSRFHFHRIRPGSRRNINPYEIVYHIVKMLYNIRIIQKI